MRIIKILLLGLLLLGTNLNANENSIVDTLSKIVKNGWSEDNKTLNQKIISYYEKNKPKILKYIKEPLKESKKLDRYGMAQLPKILLTRQDYLYILAYTKYLEKEGRFDESLRINIEILRGLHNIKENSTLSVVFHMIIEGLVRDSLFEFIKDNKNFKIDKKQYDEIQHNLILDKTYLTNAVKNEKRVLEIVFKYFLKDMIDTKKYGKKSVVYVSIISKEIKNKEDLVFKKIFNAIDIETPKSIEHLEKELKEFEKSNKCNKDKKLITINDSAKCIAKMFINATMPYFFIEISKDYFKSLKENRLLLDKLRLRVK